MPLAALPYTLGDIADVLPPDLKKKMVVTCAIIAVLAKTVQRIMERLQGLQDAHGIAKAQGTAENATVLALNLPAEKQIPPKL